MTHATVDDGVFPLVKLGIANLGFALVKLGIASLGFALVKLGIANLGKLGTKV